MILYKPTVDWAKKHASKGSDGLYRCRKTNTVLMVQRIHRTIGAPDDFPFSGLEVKQVGHVYCPACMPEPEFPKYGSSVRLADLYGYQL